MNPGETRIIGYHRIADDPNPALADWAVRVADFERQMRSLAASGYRCVTCADLMREVRTGVLPDRTIAITFDDGYLDNLTHATPILNDLGFVATIFVVSGLLGQTAAWDARYGGEMAPLANRQQILALHDLGWEIGHHTISHAGLTRLSDDELRHEVLAGHRDLEQQLGIAIEAFAYPFSMQDDRVRSLMVDTPFTEIYAAGHDPITAVSPREAVPRVFMLRDHTVDDLQALIETGHEGGQERN